MNEEERQSIKDTYHRSLIEDALELLDSPETDSIAHLRPGLKLYLTDRVETGGFLRGVLENDLDRAIGHAHPSLTMAQMKMLAGVITGSFPAKAWGSPEKVSGWLNDDAE